MDDTVLAPLAAASESELLALRLSVFEDHEESSMMSDVFAAEAAARPSSVSTEWPYPFGLVAFRGSTLVGWTEGHRQGRGQFFVMTSGVTPSERRNGVYSMLVRGVLDYAASQGYVKVNSAHAASNAAVLIAKLKLGFVVSGFEYDEFGGPTVVLTYMVNEKRRQLYDARARSLRPRR